MNEDDLTKLDQLNQLSLQRFIGIDDDIWIWLLQRCELVKESGDGKITIKKQNWVSFFTTYDIDAEIEQASPLGTNKRWCIRLGQKGENWYRNVVNQARNGKLVPPRCPGIEVMGRRMNTELQIMMFEDEECDDGDCGDTCGRDTNDNANGNADDDANGNVNSDTNSNGNECTANPSAAERPKFPLLQKYGLEHLDLSDKADNDKFKRILGEMVAK